MPVNKKNEPQEVADFIAGAEWVLKQLEKISGGAGRIVAIHTYPIKDLIEQAKTGKIDHIWKTED